MLILAKRRIRRGMACTGPFVGWPCCSGGGGELFCNSCGIPKANLSFTWDDISGCGPQTVPLVYIGPSPLPFWRTGCFGQTPNCPYNGCTVYATMQCNLSSPPPFTIAIFNPPNIPPCTCGAQPSGSYAGSCSGVIDSYTCGSGFTAAGHFADGCGVDGGLTFTISV